MERGRRAARNNDSKLFAFSERGIGSDDFCVTSWIKMMFSLATTPRKTVGNAFSCKGGARHRRKRTSKRVLVRSAAKADEDDTKDPVQETFKKLYAPNSGKRIKYGVFQETMSASEKNAYTDEEKTNLRRKAAEELTVIDKEERKRRGWFWFVFFASNPFRRAVVSPSFLRVLRARAFHRAVL